MSCGETGLVEYPVKKQLRANIHTATLQKASTNGYIDLAFRLEIIEKLGELKGPY